MKKFLKVIAIKCVCLKTKKKRLKNNEQRLHLMKLEKEWQKKPEKGNNKIQSRNK